MPKITLIGMGITVIAKNLTTDFFNIPGMADTTLALVPFTGSEQPEYPML